jgi:hypothetical protein
MKVKICLPSSYHHRVEKYIYVEWNNFRQKVNRKRKIITEFFIVALHGMCHVVVLDKDTLLQIFLPYGNKFLEGFTYLALNYRDVNLYLVTDYLWG